MKQIDLKRSITTIDAQGCQKEIAEQINRGQGAYILTVKENQPKLLPQVQEGYCMTISMNCETTCGIGARKLRTTDMAAWMNVVIGAGMLPSGILVRRVTEKVSGIEAAPSGNLGWTSPPQEKKKLDLPPR